MQFTDRAEFTIKVMVKRNPSNEETTGWVSPEDLVSFLNEHFTILEDATHGVDAYNKHAGQLVLKFES